MTKKRNKLAFQKSFHFALDREVPLIAVFIDDTPLDRLHEIEQLFQGLLTLPIQLAIIEPKKMLLKSTLRKVFQENKKVKFVPSEILERLFEATDMCLLLIENYKKSVPIQTIISAGAVPISLQSDAIPLLKNYNAKEESGNSFLFEHFNHWEIFAAVVRALENFQFSYDWKNIIEQGAIQQNLE